MSSNSRPLQGQSIALTRPQEDSGNLHAMLTALGAQVYSLPTISIRYLSPSSDGPARERLEVPVKKRNLALVSAAATRAFHHHLSISYTNAQIPAWNHIYAIGEKTRKALKELNFQYGECFTASPQNDDGLQTIIRANLEKTAYLVAPRGNKARLGWSDALSKEGYQIDRPLVYETSDASAADGPRPHQIQWALFFSPSAAQSWSRVYPGIELESCAAIGETTAKACRQQGFHVKVVASQPNELALVEALVSYVDGSRR